MPSFAHLSAPYGIADVLITMHRESSRVYNQLLQARYDASCPPQVIGQKPLKFGGIPNFAPGIFHRALIKNPMKLKALQKSLEQLTEGGARRRRRAHLPGPDLRQPPAYA